MKAFRSNVHVRDAMAQILEVNPPLLHDLVRAMAEVLELPAEAERQVAALPGPQSKERLMQWRPKVDEALNCLVFQRSSPPPDIGQVARIYGDGELTALGFCSETLHHARTELAFDREALDDVRQRISELLDVLATDYELDGELRQLLVQNLQEMLRACDSYDRRGSAAMRDAYNITIGTLVNNVHIACRHETSPATWTKVVAVLGVVAALLGSSADLVQAIEKLPSPPPALEVVLTPRELFGGTAPPSMSAERHDTSVSASDQTP